MPLITETYYLSLTQDNRGILRLRCSQDDTLRTVNLKLYNNGSIFTIPSGISAYVSGVKQNGAVFSKSCTISQDRESVVLQLSSDITNVDGIIVAEIVLSDGEGGRLGTSNFIIQIEKNPIRAGVVQDTETPIEYINDFIEKIQTLTARLNNLITPSGDPSLAEVVDARIGILDNTTYQTLGARLNAEFQRLSNALNGITILESTGDTTDRTSEILSKLNAYGTCKLGKGDFYVKNLVMPEDSMLIGFGNATRIVLLGSETNTYIVKPKSNCIIENISFYGRFTGTYSELIANSDARRHCIILDKFNDVNSENVILSNIFISNFVGSAIAQRATNGCHCKDVVISMCYAGIDISNASYDGQCTNISMTNTRYGVVQNGSNFVFSSCISKDSQHHIMSDQQNTECTFSSCTFFDSSLETTSVLAYLSNARNGFVFDNCMFDSSLKMGLNACDGIIIKGTNFVGSDTFKIIVSNGRNTLLLITDCIADVEPVVTNAGTAARITSCYLKDGTAWSISEADITVDDELSDESENPVQNKVINGAISEIKANLSDVLAPYNAVDILVGKLTKASGTSNGFTFTWVGDVCTVTGSATGYGVNILMTSGALPSSVIPGNKYYVKYNTTDANVRLRIIWKTSGKTDIRTDYFAGDASITVPSTAGMWTIALFIMNTVTLSSAVTVSGIAFINAPSNTSLFENGQYYRGNLPDGTDLNDIVQPGVYNLVSTNIYQNDAGSGTRLLEVTATTTYIIQIISVVGTSLVFKRTRGSSAWYDWKDSNGYGGKYVAFGDSLMYGAVWNAVNDGTPSHRTKEEWRIPTRIAMAINATANFENKAVGGMGYIRKVAVDGVQKNVVDLIKEYDFTDVELVTIGGGPNDYDQTLGFSDSGAGDGSICGAIMEIIEYMRTNYPKIQLIFIQSTPWVSPNVDVWSGRYIWSLNEFDEKVSELCQNQHVGYVNWYGCTYVNTWNIRNIGYASNAGPNYSHPLVDFDYCIIGDYIAGKIAGCVFAEPDTKYDVKIYSYDDLDHNKIYNLHTNSEVKTLDPIADHESNDYFSSIIIPVKAGDIVTLKTFGGKGTAKAYGIIKHNYLISSVYTDTQYFYGDIEIDHDGFLAINTMNTYSAKFFCQIKTKLIDAVRDSMFTTALGLQKAQQFPEYNPENVCKSLNGASSLAGMLHHWAVIGASFDSGEFNFRVDNNEHVSEIDWFEYSCWKSLAKMNGIEDIYIYANGGQNAKDWIALDDGNTTKAWIGWEGNISRSHAYDSDTEEVLWWWNYPTNTVVGRSGIGHDGGCWWKMKQDYENGDVKQVFVINLGSNDINNNYPHNDDWSEKESYDTDKYYTCGTTADIGTYDLATDTDTVPSGKTAGIVPGIVNSYAAYIGAILNRIIAIQPDAIIFLCTIRNGFSNNTNRLALWNQYNDTLKQIAAMDQYKNNVYILDNGEFGPNYLAQPMKKMIVYYHPNAVGYQYLAQYWNTLLDHSIQENYQKMSQSMFIGTGRKYST